MGVATSLYALGQIIDPTPAYWSCKLSTGKEWSEKSVVVDRHGIRQLDWGNDIVSTGDIHRVRELSLNCPDGRRATLEISVDMPAFQFKTKSLDMLGAWGSDLEFQVIGRVTDKETGRCECFIWDYRPKEGAEHLIAYKSNIYKFGAWRDTVTPIGALGIEVQGFRL